MLNSRRHLNPLLAAAAAFALLAGPTLSVAFAGAAAPSKKTERKWKAKCASCHGVDGKAQTTKGKEMKTEDMTTAAWQKKFTDAQLKKVTVEGVEREKDGVKQKMKGFDKLPPAVLDALVAYMRHFGPKK